MGCKYSNFTDGTCQLFDEEFPADGKGCDDDGICMCEDSPNPSLTCDLYEPDGEKPFKEVEYDEDYEPENEDLTDKPSWWQ